MSNLSEVNKLQGGEGDDALFQVDPDGDSSVSPVGSWGIE
jgi:hypothetical protein